MVQVNRIISTTGITLGYQFLNIFSRKDIESRPEHKDIYGIGFKKVRDKDRSIVLQSHQIAIAIR